MGSCTNKTRAPSRRAPDTLEELSDHLFPRIGAVITELQNRRISQFIASLKERLQQFPDRPFANFCFFRGMA